MKSSFTNPFLTKKPWKYYGGKIPFIFTHIEEELDRKNGFSEELIFRCSGQRNKVEELLKKFDNGIVSDLSEYEPNDLATTFTTYLRDLSTIDSLFQMKEMGLLMNINTQPCSDEEKIQKMTDVIAAIEEPKRNVISYIMKVMNKVTLFEEKNHMNSYSAAVCISAAIFTEYADENISKTVEFLIKNFKTIFNSKWCSQDLFMTQNEIDEIAIPAISLDDCELEESRRSVRKKCLIPVNNQTIYNLAGIKYPTVSRKIK